VPSQRLLSVAAVDRRLYCDVTRQVRASCRRMQFPTISDQLLASSCRSSAEVPSFIRRTPRNDCWLGSIAWQVCERLGDEPFGRQTGDNRVRSGLGLGAVWLRLWLGLGSVVQTYVAQMICHPNVWRPLGTFIHYTTDSSSRSKRHVCFVTASRLSTHAILLEIYELEKREIAEITFNVTRALHLAPALRLALSEFH